MIYNYFRSDLGLSVSAMEGSLLKYKQSKTPHYWGVAWEQGRQLFVVILWISDALEILDKSIKAYQSRKFTTSALLQLKELENTDFARLYKDQIAKFLSQKETWLGISVRIFNYLKYRLD